MFQEKKFQVQVKTFQVQVLKSCKSIQESSNDVQDFKAQQLARYMAIYRGLWSLVFQADFHPIHECMLGFSFLTTLNIYKNYFEGHKRLHKLHKSKFHKCEERCDWKPSLP